jgi:hypothetical protein
MVNFLRPFWHIYKVFEHERETLDKGRGVTLDGAPGTGKTLTMTYDGFVLAERVEAEHRLAVLLQQGKEKNSDVNPYASMDDYWRHLTIRQAVAYYDAHPEIISYLVANYPIQKDGRYSAELTTNHLLQLERLPEGSVIRIDESADGLSNKRSKPQVSSAEKQAIYGENEVIDETFSKERHFGDWWIGLAEQDSKENYIGIRRVVSINRNLRAMRRVCTPLRLIKRFEKLKCKILRKNDCTYKQYVKAYRLKRRVNSIGFFAFEYLDSTTDTQTDKEKERGMYSLPMNLPFQYATRAYQFQYKPLAKEIDMRVFDSLYLLPLSEKE